MARNCLELIRSSLPTSWTLVCAPKQLILFAIGCDYKGNMTNDFYVAVTYKDFASKYRGTK